MNFLVLFSMYFDGVLHSVSKDAKADGSCIVLRWGNNQIILHGVLLIIGCRTWIGLSEQALLVKEKKYLEILVVEPKWFASLTRIPPVTNQRYSHEG